MKFIEQIGGRKFAITLGCGAVTAFLTWFGKIDGTTYALVIGGTVGVYIAGNVAQKKVQS